MRGLPGSGKSTVARQLADPDGKILELDKVLIGEKNIKINDQQLA